MIRYILSLLILVSSTVNAKPVSGYADLHVHMMANYGFAGGWFTGDPNKELRSEMFKVCKDSTSWPWFKKVLDKVDPYLSSFVYRNHCVPKNESFPTWNDLSHQQVWKSHLKKAHENGLSLMVLSAVHSYVLCKILPNSRKDFNTCEDKPNLLRQLQKAKEFISRNDWVELALTPKSAREIINSGKLAVVLSIESSNLFDHKDWEQEFNEYYAAGIRTLQVVHQFDNKIAGSAVHKPPLKFAHYLRNWMRYKKWIGFDLKETEYETSFGKRSVELNQKGLTDFGKQFIEYLTTKGVAIDFAHMSEKTMQDVRMILQKYNYPHYISHGHFRDAMKDGLGRFEKSSSLETLKQLNKVDGIFGVRTITFGTHQVDKSIQNNCDGSSLSLSHMLQFGNQYKVNMAFGSDFNGFISQTRPRFSKSQDEYCSPQKIQGLGNDFDTTGLGRVDKLPLLLKDLKNLGVDTHSLEHSAEKYIQVWERSLGASQKL